MEERLIPNQYYAGLVRWTVAIPLTYVLAHLARIAFEERFLQLKQKFLPGEHGHSS